MNTCAPRVKGGGEELMADYRHAALLVLASVWTGDVPVDGCTEAFDHFVKIEIDRVHPRSDS